MNNISKDQILAQIRSTAEMNSGKPLGAKRFQDQTGIKTSDWYGIYWAKWSDAVKDAGLTPNLRTEAYELDYVIEQIIGVIREIKRFPGFVDYRLKKQEDPDFPTHSTFSRRIGGKDKQILAVLGYCYGKSGYEDVLEIVSPLAREVDVDDSVRSPDHSTESYGYVYLLKYDKDNFKIGFSADPEVRQAEWGTKLPKKPQLIHTIATDDPPGIEDYWHKRFAEKRVRGEWFNLSVKDVSAFKRRKFM